MPSVLDRLVSFLYGYNVFIAYAWADGRTYAVELQRQLRNAGLRCLLDDAGAGEEADFEPGDDIYDATQRAIASATALVLVGTPGLMGPAVVQEIPMIWTRR